MNIDRIIEILDPSDEMVNESREIVRKAIGKLIPRKPTYEGDGYGDDGNLIYDTAYCPICNHSFEYGINDWESNYCPNCGQALDWEWPEEGSDA